MIRADDGAYRDGRGCYTTIRIRAGRPRFAQRHAQRLVAGARALGLGEADGAALLDGVRALAAAAFADGEGIVRVQLSCDATGLRAVALPRALGADPAQWSAVLAPLPHDGASLAGGAKTTSRLTLALAAQRAAAAGVDEALLADRRGALVEGARTNLFVALDDGALRTPPLESGAVAGIARALVLERIADAGEAMVPVARLAGAREIVAVNAVRGARPVVALDGRAVGDGRPGPWSLRLSEALADD